MSSFLPDLVIKDPEGLPIAVIEVKNRQDLSSDIAIEMRRNMLKRGLPAQMPYFLLLSQDVGYLWKAQNYIDVPPAYTFPMENVITRYAIGAPNRRLFNTELELLILQWLMNLREESKHVVEEPEKSLEDAGFNEAIKDAAVLIGENI